MVVLVLDSSMGAWLVPASRSGGCHAEAVACPTAARCRGRASGPQEGEGARASDPLLDHEHRSGLRPKRTRIVGLYTDPPADATVICADELGPVSPRTFPPAPGWSADGHRIKARL